MDEMKVEDCTDGGVSAEKDMDDKPEDMPAASEAAEEDKPAEE